MQRRDHLGFTIRLSRKHGAGAAAAGATERINAHGERPRAVTHSDSNVRGECGGFISEHLTSAAQTFDHLPPHSTPGRSEFLTDDHGLLHDRGRFSERLNGSGKKVRASCPPLSEVSAYAAKPFKPSSKTAIVRRAPLEFGPTYFGRNVQQAVDLIGQDHVRD
jgi:hypothetical protein